MQRSKLSLIVAATLAAACESPTAPSARTLGAGDGPVLEASSSSTTRFSGKATVLQAAVTPAGIGTPVTIKLVDTGELPESGGALDGTLLKLDVSKDETAQILELGAKVGHASTVGQGKHSRAQAAVADLSLEV